MTTILKLSLLQMTGKWRMTIILLLALLPVGLMAITRFVAGDISFNSELIDPMIDGMLVGAIVPLVTMVLASSAFGNEIEDKTLGYLMLRPVPRWMIVAPKMAATVIIAGPIAVVSGVVVTVLAGGDATAAIAVGLALLSGVVAYAAIFTWAGTVTARALGFGLVYVLGWEALLSSFLSGVRYLSIRAYMLAIMEGIGGEPFEALQARVIEFPAAIVGIMLVTVVFFLLTLHRLRTMDVP